MNISHIDHLVLTVEDIPRTVEFYSQVFGMEVANFEANRMALKFGQQKINLHQVGDEHQPHAKKPTSGSVDICLVSQTPIDIVLMELREKKIELIEGPVMRTGATGTLLSIYIRDPDQNLIEISNIKQEGQA